MPRDVFLNYIAHYHPHGVIKNSHFESRLDTSAEWIESRVGIKERRYLDDYRGSYPVYELGRRAVENLGDRSVWGSDSIDFIISCGTLEDVSYPSPASMISKFLGRDVPALHLKSACTSVVYAIQVARAFIQSGMYKRILIVNGEPFTLQADYGDRTSCILFGDAGSAMVISSEPKGLKVIDVSLGGAGMDIVGAFRRSPTSYLSLHEFVSGQKERRAEIQQTIGRMAAGGKFHQYGREVSQFVLKTIPQKTIEFVTANKFQPSELSTVIFHQANLKLLNELCDRIGVDHSKHAYNIDRFGNTSSAGWVSVLSEQIQRSKFKLDDLILISAFGAGMTWGNVLLKSAG